MWEGKDREEKGGKERGRRGGKEGEREGGEGGGREGEGSRRFVAIDQKYMCIL